MNIISLPQGGGSGGGGGASLFTFPLSIQEDQPTPEDKGHIWVLPSDQTAKITKIYIVNALSKDLDDNSLILVCDTNTNLKIDISDKITRLDKRLDFEFHSESYGYHDWAIATDEESSISSRFPYVFTKDNGYFYVETAKMWNGTYWSGLSTKDRYLFNWGYQYYFYSGGSHYYSQPLLIKNVYDSDENSLSVVDNTKYVPKNGSFTDNTNPSGFTFANFSKNGDFLYFIIDMYSVVVYKRIGNIFEEEQTLFSIQWINTGTVDGVDIPVQTAYIYFGIDGIRCTYSGDRIIIPIINKNDGQLYYIEYVYDGLKYNYNRAIPVDISSNFPTITSSDWRLDGSQSSYSLRNLFPYQCPLFTSSDDLEFTFEDLQQGSSGYFYRFIFKYDDVDKKYKAIAYYKSASSSTTVTLTTWILGNNIWLNNQTTGQSFIYVYDGKTINTGDYLSNTALGYNTSTYLSRFGVLKSLKYPNKILLYRFQFSDSTSSGYYYPSQMWLYDIESNKVLASNYANYRPNSVNLGTNDSTFVIVSQISPYTGKAFAVKALENNYGGASTGSLLHVVKFDIDSIFENDTITDNSFIVEDLQTLDNQICWSNYSPPDSPDYFSTHNFLFNYGNTYTMSNTELIGSI